MNVRIKVGEGPTGVEVTLSDVEGVEYAALGEIVKKLLNVVLLEPVATINEEFSKDEAAWLAKNPPGHGPLTISPEYISTPNRLHTRLKVWLSGKPRYFRGYHSESTHKWTVELSEIEGGLPTVFGAGTGGSLPEAIEDALEEVKS